MARVLPDPSSATHNWPLLTSLGLFRVPGLSEIPKNLSSLSAKRPDCFCLSAGFVPALFWLCAMAKLATNKRKTKLPLHDLFIVFYLGHGRLLVWPALKSTQ